MDTLSNALASWKELYRAKEQAEHQYDLVYAVARKEAADLGIAANDRKFHADVQPAVKDARSAKIDADTAFKYAEERLKGIHAAIRAWQSVGTSVRQAYATSNL